MDDDISVFECRIGEEGEKIYVKDLPIEMDDEEFEEMQQILSK